MENEHQELWQELNCNLGHIKSLFENVRENKDSDNYQVMVQNLQILLTKILIDGNKYHRNTKEHMVYSSFLSLISDSLGYFNATDNLNESFYKLKDSSSRDEFIATYDR